MPQSTPTLPRAKWRTAFDVSATVLMLAAAAVLIWENLASRTPAARPSRKPIGIPSNLIAIDSAPSRGASGAKVALIEYSEFQCPFCGKAARDVLPTLDASYVLTGKVRVVFKNFPLPKHKFARGAAEAALCAGGEAKFWPMHDLLFSNQDKLGDDAIEGFAAKVGLDAARFSSCRKAKTTADLISADISEGERLGIQATPTFFIGTVQPNGRVRVTEALEGAGSSSRLVDALERTLSKNQ